MAVVVRSPGSCGEFIQGSLNGKRFLVTCPINRFSYAMVDVQKSLPASYISLQPKAQMAIKQTMNYLQLKEMPLPIYMRSEIIQGKGMASSSADISAVALATALSANRELSMNDLTKISLSIEPSDATFYPEIVQFDYINGEICQPLGVCPPLKIAIFDEGGIIDTLAFNSRIDLATLISEKEGLIEEALTLFIKALKEHDIKKLGQAITISSFANQRILPKKYLYELHELGEYYHSLGTIIAHSGTIMGLIFPVGSPQIDICIKEVLHRIPQLTLLDIVETCNFGITYSKI